MASYNDQVLHLWDEWIGETGQTYGDPNEFVEWANSRAKQSVTLFENGLATKHYFDTDTGGTQLLREKSVRQRREAIAHDVYRGMCDVERMNKVFSDEPQLNFLTDFTEDAAELRIAENSGRDEEDAA